MSVISSRHPKGGGYNLTTVSVTCFCCVPCNIRYTEPRFNFFHLTQWKSTFMQLYIEKYACLAILWLTCYTSSHALYFISAGKYNIGVRPCVPSTTSTVSPVMYTVIVHRLKFKYYTALCYMWIVKYIFVICLTQLQLFSIVYIRCIANWLTICMYILIVDTVKHKFNFSYATCITQVFMSPYSFLSYNLIYTKYIIW
jgi:hypothetical protein